ncbi:SpoIID/LytB domain-containing protein [Candidatus Cyanaurora vandensis]|uniref:SpoIID/LytB domain-containing protein n=1 Tax=Candidatus Cyanaurora vandensis TaxID=2714958 RepID=UPI00257F5011|nr:SpoIID/LytB domain-containing protein [Candidatus Cyanaurora vandensis]
MVRFWLLLMVWVMWSPAAQAFVVRVLVEGPSPALEVAVSVPAKLVQDNGQVIPVTPLQVQRITPAMRGVLTVKNGYILVGDRWYPETVRFEAIKGKIAAVNWVESETYLRGVVPREMPASWNLQALMAQAIAARTYAYISRIERKWGPIYDLVDDERDQVYGGFAKLDPRSGKSSHLVHARADQAVAQTAGVILGTGNVRGYYRANVGWVRDSNGYYLPVMKGAVMDQTVTGRMAKAGWDYYQILQHWYKTPLYRLQEPTVKS